MNELTITIKPTGEIVTIYDDALLPLITQGNVVTTRASHVEPAPSGKDWYVDLHPVGGGKFWGFPTRAAALAFEREYINRHSL